MANSEQSNETGRFEVYVRPFPDANSGRWLISAMGGTQPLWSHDGRELFYVESRRALMSVAVTAAGAWNSKTAVKLFEGGFFLGSDGVNPFRMYDVTKDGRRFLMIKPEMVSGVAGPPNVIVVLNWFQELRRLAPLH